MSLLPFGAEYLQKTPPSGFGGKSFAGVPQSEPASAGVGSGPESVVGPEGSGFSPESGTVGRSTGALLLSVHASRSATSVDAITRALASPKAICRRADGARRKRSSFLRIPYSWSTISMDPPTMSVQGGLDH
jgi:hypothetical protein